MLNRREFAIAALSIAALWDPTNAFAESQWPDRPVRLLVPYPPGGGVDIAARLIASKLSDIWNQPVVIENRPGASTLIAAQTVASAAKDGYTMLVTNGTTFFLPAINSNVKLRPLDDFVSIAALTVDQLVVITPAPVQAQTLQQFFDLAKSDPNSFPIGSFGYGTLPHLFQYQVNKTKGLDLAHIPYRGTAQMVQAMLAGDIKLAISNYATAKGFIESGRLRVMAVTGSPRSPFLPSVPTLGEAGVPGFDMVQWVGLFAPTGTPQRVVQRVAQDVARVLAQDSTVKALAAQYTLPGRLSTDEFGQLVRHDARLLGDMSQAAAIKMDE